MHVLKLPTSLSLLVLLLLPSLLYASSSSPGSGSGSSSGSALYPPGLLPLITKANTLLSTGQFSEAIRAYTDAIDQSPQDPTLYYKRATAYLSQSRHQQALSDLNRVLQLSGSSTSSSFERVYLLQAKIHAKEGDFTLAREAAQTYISHKSSSQSQSHQDKDKRDLHEAHTLLSSLTTASTAAHRAEQSFNARLYTACSQSATDALALASHSRALRELRAECEVGGGDVEAGVGDLIRLTHLTNPTTSLFLRIAHLSFFLLPQSQSQHITPLKQCLHFDPDSKPCLKTHRTFKALDKAFGALEGLVGKSEWRGVVRAVWGSGGASGGAKEGKGEENLDLSSSNIGTGLLYDFTHALYASSSTTTTTTTTTTTQPHLPTHLSPTHTSPRLRTLHHALCVAYTRLEQPKRARRFCDAVLEYNPPGYDQTQGEETEGGEQEWRSDSIYIDAMVGKAESLLAGENEDGEVGEAVRLLEKAFERGGRANGDVLQRLQKAQRILKQSKRKDYYKLLGVARDADERTVKKAYRKQAKLAHPDKGGSESAMAAVNEAYEVLSSPELRARFDAGEDPMDPVGGGAQYGGGGGSPFGGAGGGFGGGHPFAQFFSGAGGGGGQQFQFHFRGGH